MCYDYHGQWDKKTGHVAPLYYHPQDDVDFFNTVSNFHITLEHFILMILFKNSTMLSFFSVAI